jgi:hypothetical protein
LGELPPGGDPDDAVPARARDLGGRPPAWIGVGTLDLLSNECVEYAYRLKQSGVQCALEVVPYLFRKVSDSLGRPAILYDECDTLFGAKAKEHEEVRGMINAGHRKGAVAGRCVVRGKVVATEELPAYAAVALAGLDDLPDTMMSRSVIVRMKRRATRW